MLKRPRERHAIHKCARRHPVRHVVFGRGRRRRRAVKRKRTRARSSAY